ncbi:MAG TPA: YihY/virulence factor BrkB family protein [Azospira sp.]|nr:YihY/virulence factor BrkB family protein [Azospira sp.]
MDLRQLRGLIEKSVNAWIDDFAPSMGAALAYYTLFSIAPLLIIVIAIAGLVFGEDAARGEIVAQIQGLIGRDGAIAVQGLLKSTSEPAQGAVAIVISTVMLIIGATTVFAELQSALDRIWRVPVPARRIGIFVMLRKRLLSFGLVLGLGFLLLVSLLISAAIAAVGKWWGDYLAGWEVIFQAIDFCISFAISTVLFAMIYKLMPQARIAWRDVWIGAAVTALLFEIGKLLIGLYLGKTSVASGFGAAGSLVVLLVWVYFAAQVFLLGAEFTWAYAHERGSQAELSGQRPAPAASGMSGGAPKGDSSPAGI